MKNWNVCFVGESHSILGHSKNLEASLEAAWITLRDTVYNTAMECLGPSTRRHRHWFDEYHAEIMDLIGGKGAVHLAHLHDPQCTTKKDAL